MPSGRSRQRTTLTGIGGANMEDDAAMLHLLEWCERTLEELNRERETEWRAQDGTTINLENA